MTSKSKATAPKAAESEVPLAERIDMNDPTLSDAEIVARNLGLTEPAAAPESE